MLDGCVAEVACAACSAPSRRRPVITLVAGAFVLVVAVVVVGLQR